MLRSFVFKVPMDWVSKERGINEPPPPTPLATPSLRGAKKSHSSITTAICRTTFPSTGYLTVILNTFSFWSAPPVTSIR